jgi:hypothetical protein
MKLLLALVVLALVIGLVAHVLRRGARDAGYRRRFENAYRHDGSADAGFTAPVFISSPGDYSGASHHSPGQGHAVDCGAHVAHSDGGASGCGGGH